jgi:hypothetical protein
MIAIAITATAIAEIKLRRVTGIVVLIAKRLLPPKRLPSLIMILFAPASGKPVNFSCWLRNDPIPVSTNSPEQSFRRETVPWAFMDNQW